MRVTFKNLVIRNATIADAEQLAEWWNDGTIMAHAGFPKGINQHAEDIAKSLAHDRDDLYRRLMIEVSQIPVGEMHVRNKGAGTAEIGIKICDFSLHDKGLGKILLSMLISSLFNDMGYKRITLDTNVNNKRAQHVYEELGFQSVGLHENAWKNQLGEWQSSIAYEMYQEDFINYAKE